MGQPLLPIKGFADDGGMDAVQGDHVRTREDGFTVVEILIAAIILVVGLLALLMMIIASDHAIAKNRVRQAETSAAREVLEDARSLLYTQLNPTSIASALQPVVPGATIVASASVPTLQLSRSIYTFQVAFTSICSLDDSSDGYGSHSQAPASGGSWCPDVAASGTTDPQPDDYKRVSVTVTPFIGGVASTPVVQQSILIYARPTHGPAVTCLTTTSGSCPGTNVSITSPATTSVPFFVTTNSTADRIQWLVNGSQPPSNEIAGGATDPYAPGGTSSSFTWGLPQVSGVYIDGTFTITAIAYDSNGNAGTRSTLQVTVNRHVAIAPASVSAGWNAQINGVDIQWLPSIDQDLLYYQVWHQIGTGAASQVTTVPCASTILQTSCYDLSAPAPTEIPACAGIDVGTSDKYWVLGVDTDPSTGQPRPSTALSPSVDANICDHPPNAPVSLLGTLSNGTMSLSWTMPSPQDPDSGDSIQGWRIYRWTQGGTVQFPGSRYALVGVTGGGGSTVTSFSDGSADPGGVAQSYCVTSVDTHLNESPCSGVVSG